MSLISRLTAAFQAVGADIKALQAKTDYATVANYRSSYDGGWLYVGYELDGTAVIKRSQENTIQTASSVTNLTTDWADRTTLNYS